MRLPQAHTRTHADTHTRALAHPHTRVGAILTLGRYNSTLYNTFVVLGCERVYSGVCVCVCARAIEASSSSAMAAQR